MNLPFVDFTGINGNAFSLMAHWKMAAKKTGWAYSDIKKVLKEATQLGDYDHLIRVLLKYSKSTSEPPEKNSGGLPFSNLNVPMEQPPEHSVKDLQFWLNKVKEDIIVCEKIIKNLYK